MIRAFSISILTVAIFLCVGESLAQSTSATPAVSREQRERALTKLLEGQRSYRQMIRTRGQSGWASASKPAREAFLEAVRLDPTLAEAYTALAEISASVPPGDVDEALNYAALALKADAKNFGAKRIQARLITVKTGLNGEVRDQSLYAKAVEAWIAVTELDPRNAEAWAFLSELYREQGKSDERIDALRKWLSSALPSETRFYQTVMGSDSDLSPEAAGVQLGEALLDAGRIAEAVEVLNNAVADGPEDTLAVDLLRQALELSDSKTAAVAIETLQQAVFANPGNNSLVIALARVLARNGRTDEALKVIADKAGSARSSREAASELRIAAGDILAEAGRIDAAVKEYQAAISARGIAPEGILDDEARDVFVDVTEKILRTLRFADRYEDAEKGLEQARRRLVATDSFYDRQKIAIAREMGRMGDALQLVRSARLKFPTDPSFVRMEARVLVDSGKIEDGVRIIRALKGKSMKDASPAYDDFANMIFIASLYGSVGKSREAVDAANEAATLAVTDDRQQIAMLAVASGHQRGGDRAVAEGILRKLLADLPGNPLAQNNLGYLLAEKNEKLDEALNLILKAVKTDPGNPSYLDSLGWVYARLGRNELAKEYLNRALILDPSSSVALDHLGDVYKALGDMQRAKEYWRRAYTLSVDPKRTEELNAKLGRRSSK